MFILFIHIISLLVLIKINFTFHPLSPRWHYLSQTPEKLLPSSQSNGSKYTEHILLSLSSKKQQKMLNPDFHLTPLITFYSGIKHEVQSDYPDLRRCEDGQAWESQKALTFDLWEESVACEVHGVHVGDGAPWTENTISFCPAHQLTKAS